MAPCLTVSTVKDCPCGGGPFAIPEETLVALLCCVCRVEPVVANHRCKIDYEYLRTHDYDRDADLIEVQLLRKEEVRLGLRPPKRKRTKKLATA